MVRKSAHLAIDYRAPYVDRVSAVGDLFTPGTPEPDYSAGGSLVGWGPVLGWRFGFTGDQLDRFYAEMSAKD